MEKKKYKVAVIGVKGLPGYGGSANANEHILKRLSHKYDITVYALDTHAKKENYHGIKQHIFASYKSKKVSTLIYYIKSLYAVMFQHNYHIIHLNHSVSGFLLPFLKAKGCNTITTIRGLVYEKDDKWNFFTKLVFKWFQYLSFKLSDIITTVQKSSVFYIRQYTKKPVYYVPNGVELNYKQWREIEKKDIITFSAARIIYLKGCHDFLKALININYKGRVRIIGDLNHSASYKQSILRLAVDLNTEFLGLIKNTDELYKRIKESKLFVFPSYSEGMSNMLLEVASLKVPVIASNIQPNKDIFTKDEVTFYKVGDYIELGEKIKSCLKDSNNLEAKANRAIKKIRSKYDWDKISADYEKLYEKVIKNKDET